MIDKVLSIRVINCRPDENFSQNFYTNWNIFQKTEKSLHLFLEFFIHT